MTITTYQVKGMSCDHCVRSVTEEVSKIAGVNSVDIDLESGRVTVSSDLAVDDAAMRDAVDEAGYELVG